LRRRCLVSTIGTSNLDCIESCHVVPERVRREDLDAGEEAALALALQIHADAILLDERRAYVVAQDIGLTPIGILNVLLRAKAAGLLAEVKPVLDGLQKDANFWISQTLREEVLRIAHES
jgi:predicted nucleic acid-binding protein